jgi:hypothetical protein
VMRECLLDPEVHLLQMLAVATRGFPKRILESKDIRAAAKT